MFEYCVHIIITMHSKCELGNYRFPVCNGMGYTKCLRLCRLAHSTELSRVECQLLLLTHFLVRTINQVTAKKQPFLHTTIEVVPQNCISFCFCIVVTISNIRDVEQQSYHTSYE